MSCIKRLFEHLESSLFWGERLMHASRLRKLFLLLTGFLGLALVVPAADPQPAGDWPTPRGNPLQTGVTAVALPERLEVLWQFKAQDSIEATAAIAGGVVYIGSFDQHLYALELANGKEKWRYKAGPFTAPPSYREGAVYVGDADGMFHCIDAETGKKRWTFDAGAEITSGVNFTGDTVLFGCGDETLYCLFAKDGKPRWKFKVPGGPVNGSPVVAGERTFAAGCDSSLHILDTTTGKELGTVNLQGQVGAAAAVAGDHLYVGTMSSEVLAVNWKKEDITWQFASEKRKQPFYAAVAVTDKLVIAGSRDRHVYGLDRQTGREVWSFPTRDRVESSPVVAGRRVYAASLDKNLYVLDLDKGTELQRIPLGGTISASPAVADGRLVIGNQNGTVYCLGAPK